MTKQHNAMPTLHDVIEAALHDTFLKAAERAKQTRTYLVFEKNHKIERIPYDQIDAFIAKENSKNSNSS